MIRAIYGQLKNPMMKISNAIRSWLPSRPNAWSGKTPASAIAKTSSGKARNISISRLVRVSTQPPRKPEMIPSVVPIATDNRVARRAINSEIRLPYTIRLKMSRPFTGSMPMR